MKKAFDDLNIGTKFKVSGREWQKVTEYAAKCLSKNSPFEPDANVAVERKTIVEVDDSDPNSIFKRRK